MFTLCLQKDTIRVEARDFGKDPVVALREEINRRYANKVIPQVGLCLALLDIVDATEGTVLYGDGCFYYKTEFRLIVFRPHIGEAFLGKVQSSSEAGIRVSIGFFDDILVPPHLLPEYCVFDATRRAFFWVPPPEDSDTPLTSDDLLKTLKDERLYIERKDWIRIRVEEEHWDDTSPGTGRRPPVDTPAPSTNGAPPQTPVERLIPPFSIICSMTEAGTGVVEWWEEEDDDEKDS